MLSPIFSFLLWFGGGWWLMERVAKRFFYLSWEHYLCMRCVDVMFYDAFAISLFECSFAINLHSSNTFC
ncbi:hypothetical protein OIU84_021216 [Salix udensis]|uniref:Uncharacterized protein n=1 Tax=Salix udensis TaxID=889485 RepID=A0AAD6KU52_9ROSI|nr:hypothetical protein OIU84_021216 [Salix udensis]